MTAYEKKWWGIFIKTFIISTLALVALLLSLVILIHFFSLFGMVAWLLLLTVAIISCMAATEKASR